MIKKENNEEQIIQFVEEMCKLQPVQFIGLMEHLGLRVFSDEIGKNGLPIARDAEEMVLECINYFAGANRKTRRSIMKIVKQANKEGV